MESVKTLSGKLCKYCQCPRLFCRAAQGSGLEEKDSEAAVILIRES